MGSLWRDFRSRATSPAEGIKAEVNKEQRRTRIERTPEDRCVEVTAPNGSGQEQRGRTLDCSALTPDETHHAPSHRRDGAQSECEWKRGKGVPSWIVGALVITLTLTREAFSWKPFVSKRDRYAPYPDTQEAMIEAPTPY